jgi:YD repeat-containing protein
MRQIVLFVSFLVFSLGWFTNAEEPNYLKSTIFKVDGTNNVITTDYSDGLQRAIQSKQQLSGGKALVVSTFYDDAGRPYIATKPFIDKASNPNNLFTPGDFTEINATLNNTANYENFKISGSAYAYSETQYYDDPLGRVKRAGAPGNDYRLTSEHFTSSWTFGIVKNLASPIHLTVDANDRYIKITDGFVTAFSNSAATIPVPLTYKILDELYDELLQNPIANADYFLSVSRDPDKKISQELKELFGKTIATRAGEDAGPIIAGYDFDILGNVLFEHAPKNGSSTLISDSKYEYNTLGQLVRKETPDGAIERMLYDNAGNISRKSTYYFDGTSEVLDNYLDYSYDEMARLKRITAPYNGGGLPLVKYYYDTTEEFLVNAKNYSIPFVENLVLQNTQGRLVAEVASNRPAGELFYTGKPSYVADVYSYNDEGLVQYKYKLIPGLPLQKISYAYDDHGKILTEEFNCGSTISKKFYNYDEYGNLKNIAHGNSTNIVVSYKYDLLGKFDTTYFTKIASGNMLSRTHNIRGWMDTSRFNGGNSFEQILDYNGTGTPTYNGNIRESKITYKQGSTVVPYTQNYSYDFINRLSSVETKDGGTGLPVPKFDASYIYDKAGRFTSKKEGSTFNDVYDYYNQLSTTPDIRKPSRLKKAKSVDGGLYIYDIRGNLIIDKKKNLYIQYDWRNMPIKFSFYNNLPVDETTGKIRPDEYGAITIHDVSYTYPEPLYYIDWLYAKGQIELLSSVQMFYDAAGNRVLKIEK